MNRANFISVEDEGVDLVLSFALDDEALGVCSGQVILATALCSIQYKPSFLFGLKPLLNRCGLT